MTLTRFSPPGGLDDLDAAGQGQWSTWLSETVDTAIAGRTDHPNDSPRAQFFNLTRTDTAPDAKDQDVTWIGFPRQVSLQSVSDHQRWSRADASRDVQDEYCEWSVTRRPDDGKITRVTFTCEGPEYWEILAAATPDKVVALYQQHVNPAVQHDDLFDSKGHYIRRNRWNTDTVNGAMHLVQDANTLGAEVELAAAATIVRVINGRELTGEQELIACSQYGVPTRNSDPHIGGVVNSVARLRADIALADPVGLYFNDLATPQWAAPDGSDPKSYWTLTRGTQDHPVRAVYEVPPSKPFTVGDITINGTPIAFGAQIVDFISMKLTAVACRIGQSQAQPMTGCVSQATPSPVAIQRHTAGASTLNSTRLPRARLPRRPGSPHLKLLSALIRTRCLHLLATGTTVERDCRLDRVLLAHVPVARAGGDQPVAQRSRSSSTASMAGRNSSAMTLPDGTVIPPTGKAFDVEFGQTTQWHGDQLIVISAFWDSALQARQLGLA